MYKNFLIDVKIPKAAHYVVAANCFQLQAKTNLNYKSTYGDELEVYLYAWLTF